MAAPLRAKRHAGADQWRRHMPPRSVGSSGSEHSADDCLSEMVLDFLEDGCRSSSPPEPEGCCSDAAELDVVAADCTEVVGEIRSVITAVNGGDVEPYRELLVANVCEAAEMASSDGVVSQRRLVTFLREFHHNAAICKTKWGNSGDLAAGDYEFIDVVNGNVRYLIDANFRAQFEIARATIHYSELLKFLPTIFIGTPVELKRIVRIMCDAAKRSLSRTKLSIPPWRKNNYMVKKWLGSYRRTTNPIPDKMSVSNNSLDSSVKCRWFGFDVCDVEVNDRAFICLRSIKAVKRQQLNGKKI